MLKYFLLVLECSIAVLLVFIYSDIRKSSLNSYPLDSYAVTCVDNISYVIFNNRVATVKYDEDGEVEPCDLGE